MNGIATVFALRRSLETGEIELDMYMQFDYETTKKESLKAHAVAALDGVDKFKDPMNELSAVVSSMKMRTRFDHAIIGLYGFKGDHVMDRHEFWDTHSHWPLEKYKQFRI